MLERQQVQRALLKQLAPDEFRHVHVKFCVISKDQRRVDDLPDGSGQNGGHHRTVAVEQVYLLLLELAQRLRGKGIACQIPEQLPGIHAGIPGYWEGKPAVVGIRMLRRHHDSLISQLRQLLRVIHNRIGHAVDQRRKGIVQKANAVRSLHTMFSFLHCTVSCLRESEALLSPPVRTRESPDAPAGS